MLWWLHQLSQMLGVVGWTGIVLLLVAAWLWQFKLLPLEDRLYEQNVLLSTQDARLRDQTAADAGRLRLRPAARFTDFLRELMDLAISNGIVLSQTYYNVSRDVKQRLVRHTIRFTTVSPYEPCRAFLDGLQTIPGVRLESAVMSRQRITQDTLTLQLEFSYLAQEGS